MLKGVIFDMDGLMIDTEKLLTRFWCEAANHYGYPMTKETFWAYALLQRSMLSHI